MSFEAKINMINMAVDGGQDGFPAASVHKYEHQTECSRKFAWVNYWPMHPLIITSLVSQTTKLILLLHQPAKLLLQAWYERVEVIQVSAILPQKLHESNGRPRTDVQGHRFSIVYPKAYLSIIPYA